MAPIAFAGALQPKKKSELQDIALALNLSDHGTKDELHNRIKKHLDRHQSTLEEDSMFSGLFGRRKKSVQPQPPSNVKPSPSKSLPSRRGAALEPVRESTPVSDLRDVSTFLKHPISPVDSTPNQSPHRIDATTPSSLPPLPPSPSKSIVEHLPQPADVNALVHRIKQHEVLQHGAEKLLVFRSFLSNSRNIWTLTAVFEILYILYTITPWQTIELPFSMKGGSGPYIRFMYPQWSVFQTSAFWKVVFHWAMPALIIPVIAGTMISFNAAGSHARPLPGDHPEIAPFDPLTASIIRLAAQIAYPYPSLDQRLGTKGFDVLGYRWRVLNAAVGLAFAFAEAIAGTPQIFAKTLMTEQHHDRLLEDGTERSITNRRALMPEETIVEEVD